LTSKEVDAKTLEVQEMIAKKTPAKKSGCQKKAS
jgi:hypothetical protein